MKGLDSQREADYSAQGHHHIFSRNFVSFGFLEKEILGFNFSTDSYQVLKSEERLADFDLDFFRKGAFSFGYCFVQFQNRSCQLSFRFDLLANL